MKNILLEIINNDISYNKSATRYLPKTHSDLWQQILDKTLFLPITAKPKQRVWHIINEIYEVPKCPVTGQQVKWWENRYLETANRSAKATNMNLTGRLKNQTFEAREKRRISVLKSIPTRKPQILSAQVKQQRVAKTKQTSLERYGVSNPGKSIASRQKVSDARIRNGATPLYLRTQRRLYYDAVWITSEESWKTNFNNINPLRLNRSTHALDHIYSIQEGFRNNIPPEIIGNCTNLRVISLSENSKKGMHSDKTLDELLDDYLKFIIG